MTVTTSCLRTLWTKTKKTTSVLSSKLWIQFWSTWLRIWGLSQYKVMGRWARFIWQGRGWVTILCTLVIVDLCCRIIWKSWLVTLLTIFSNIRKMKREQGSKLIRWVLCLSNKRSRIGKNVCRTMTIRTQTPKARCHRRQATWSAFLLCSLFSVHTPWTELLTPAIK